MIVRREHPRDHDAVRALHEAAFGRPVEAALLDELREDAGFLPHLWLVAVDGEGVIGHVIATRGRLEPFGTPALGLGPIGVRRDRQRGGIGTVLVHALLGSPGYYRRFGFVRSTDLGIRPPDPAWGEHFQARRLAGPPLEGTFRYADPFDRL